MRRFFDFSDLFWELGINASKQNDRNNKT
jgi:hypothetical protein